MPLFFEFSSNTIVFRTHEFNTEVVDGKLEPVSTEIACILQHIPNKKWEYDVRIISEKPVDIAWKEFEKLGGLKQTSPPEPYYRITLKDKVDEYLQLNNLKIKSEIVNNNIIDLNISPLNTPSFNPQYKLIRNNETLTYRYKPPNLK